MNVSTLEMPKEEAREKLKAVRAQLHRKADAEYSQLEAAYRSVARGMRLLNISEVFTNCPLDDKGRPRLALMRADQRQVELSGRDKRWSDAGASFLFASTDTHGRYNRRSGARDLNLRVMTQREPFWNDRGYSLVPLVPPEHRKSHSLNSHFILWEVEQWSDVAIRSIPERDPYLLRRIGGDLYAIVAEWDLTDIERAVMAGRARQ